ncbi:MAG: Grx4 family monothiol glutaredoxin [Candidatus Endonucleobacter sp. (ex Gigantidas childressi)]|nr:Grx4 family monothiol glutaredoxin [Candidatus Endonucleobacter sp. (ex Gigantidas childressi)]
MDIIDTIKEQIASHDILLYMKGSPKLPQCGFSSQAVKVLIDCGAKFAYVDILANPDVRASLPKYADWPTFPQLWIKSELIGGSDIMLDMYNSGDLQKIISEVVGKPENEDAQ